MRTWHPTAGPAFVAMAEVALRDSLQRYEPEIRAAGTVDWLFL